MNEQLNSSPNTTGNSTPSGWDKLAEMAPATTHDTLPPMPISEPGPVLPDYAAQAEADRNDKTLGATTSAEKNIDAPKTLT